MSKLENTLSEQLDREKIEYEREYRFHPTRKWRFDFAFPEHKLAVECEGGIFMHVVTCHKCHAKVMRKVKSGKWVYVRSGGRHNRGSGALGDIMKYNSATLLGWRLLRFDAKLIDSGEALHTIERVIGRRL